MSNYTKTTNFATKDALASGNPAKIVKGTEIDTEFNNIAVASSTKANKADPVFTGTATLPVTNASSLSIGGDGVTVTGIKDEDDMASNSATKLASQQSIKAYVDAQVTAQDLDVTDGTTSISIDLDSEALSLLGGTGVTSTASGNGVTIAIDGTVATLSGSQTLTNKTLAAPAVTGALTTNSTIDGRDVAVDGTKLDTIETNADVTDTANVTAAGALMDSEVTNLAQVKAFDSTDYATAAQGTTADAALPRTGGAMTGAITTNSTFDGRNVSVDGTKLDGIEALADVTDTANVTAAGALMDSELTSIASVKALDQGVATTDSPTFAAATVTGTATMDGLVVGDGHTIGDDLFDNLLIEAASGEGIRLVDNHATNPLTVDSNVGFRVQTILGTDRFFVDNVTGTATMGGLSVDGTIAAPPSIRISNNGGTWAAGDEVGRLQFYTTDPSGAGAREVASVRSTTNQGGTTTDGTLEFWTSPYDTVAKKSMEIDGRTGDISFYEDTGTTAKLTWDASAELLTTSGLDVTGTATMDGLTVDGVAKVLGTAGNTLIIADATETNGYQLKANTSATADFGFLIETLAGKDLLKIESNNDISFYEDTGTTAKLFWDASAESLGIGTSSPSAKLEISGVKNTSEIRLSSTTNDSSWATNDYFGKLSFYSADASAAGAGIKGSIVSATTSSSGATPHMAFNVASTSSNEIERMRIDSSGNLLVGKSATGTGTVGAELRANGFNAFVRDGGEVMNINRLSSDGTIIDFRKDSSTVGGIGVALSDNLYLSGVDAGIGCGTGAIYPANTTGQPSDNDIDLGTASTRFQDLYLSGGLRGDTLTFSNLSGAEAMRIDSSGNLLVGKTSASSATIGFQVGQDGFIAVTRASGQPLVLNRTTTDGVIADFRKDGTTVGSISVTASATAYNTSSDQRLKENIADADDAGSKIDAIQVRQYDWKADGSHQDYGMIAQELQAVAPEAVSGDADSEEMMGVDYSKLVPMLIKEIQSLRNRVASLETGE